MPNTKSLNLATAKLRYDTHNGVTKIRQVKNKLAANKVQQDKKLSVKKSKAIVKNKEDDKPLTELEKSKKQLTNVLKGMGKNLSSMKSSLKNIGAKQITKIKSAFKTDLLKSTIRSGINITKGLGKILGALTKSFIGVIIAIGIGLMVAFFLFPKTLKALFDRTSNTLEKEYPGIKSAIDGLMNIFEGVFTWVLETLQKIYSSFNVSNTDIEAALRPQVSVMRGMSVEDIKNATGGEKGLVLLEQAKRIKENRGNDIKFQNHDSSKIDADKKRIQALQKKGLINDYDVNFGLRDDELNMDVSQMLRLPVSDLDAIISQATLSDELLKLVVMVRDYKKNLEDWEKEGKKGEKPLWNYKLVKGSAGAGSKIIETSYKNASGVVKSSIKNASILSGVDEGLLKNVAFAESNFNPNAAPGTSSAKGLYQLTSVAVNDVINSGVLEQKKYSGILKVKDGKYDLFDPFTNSIIGTEYIKKIVKSLKDNNLPITAGNIYASYFAGPGGFRKLLASIKRDPNFIPANSNDKDIRSAVKANHNIFYYNNTPLTGNQVLERLNNKVGESADKITVYDLAVRQNKLTGKVETYIVPITKQTTSLIPGAN